MHVSHGRRWSVDGHQNPSKQRREFGQEFGLVRTGGHVLVVGCRTKVRARYVPPGLRIRRSASGAPAPYA
jgi:hypothetical protein